MVIKNKKKVLIVILSFLFLFIYTQSEQAKADANQELVVIIPIHKEVEKGLAAFIKRGISIAEEKAADHIIFDMHTPGGAVDAAGDIAKLIRAVEIPTTVFVNKAAISAGAYLALNADQIVMVPGATMGAAAIIDSQGNTAGKKAESMWLSEMRGAASLNNRDPIYAQAMVDVDVDLPEYNAPAGKLLTLTSSQAKEVGYAEAVVESKEDLLHYLKLTGAELIEVDVTFAEKIARLITHPVVIPILLSVGSLGLVLELYSPGFGIPGIMGLSALALFFYGHLVAGLAGMESVILIIFGIIAIVLELFIPGGILGVIGVAAIIGSLLISAESVTHMAISIFIALSITIVASIVMFKVFGLKKGFFRHIILSESTSTEKGYVSYDDRSSLKGMEGKTMTPLRPSGTAAFDEKRIDVVTEGGFILEGKRVKVIEVSGAKVVVREVTKEEEEKNDK